MSDRNKVSPFLVHRNAALLSVVFGGGAIWGGALVFTQVDLGPAFRQMLGNQSAWVATRTAVVIVPLVTGFLGAITVLGSEFRQWITSIVVAELALIVGTALLWMTVPQSTMIDGKNFVVLGFAFGFLGSIGGYIGTICRCCFADRDVPRRGKDQSSRPV